MLLTVYYPLFELSRFREALAKIEQIRIIVPVEIANISLEQEKIKLTMSFPEKYKELVLEVFGRDTE